MSGCPDQLGGARLPTPGDEYPSAAVIQSVAQIPED